MNNDALSEKNIHYLKTNLLARRREILEQRNALRSNRRELEEPEKELEESAFKENLARDLERLENRGIAEIQAIDEALERLEEGDYGLCVSCGEPISLKRLSALPWARECVECAAGHERTSRSAGSIGQAEEIESEEPDDDDIMDAIRDELERNDQINTEGVAIEMRDGLLSLSGILRTEHEHQALLELIHEEFGVDEVLDRLEIGETVYEEVSGEDLDMDIEADEKEEVLGNRSSESDPLSAMENEDNKPMVPPDRLRRDSKM